MLAKIRGYVPNFLTLVSIAFGLTSIILSSQEYLSVAGYLIFGSFFMDAIDGVLARKWEAQTVLGMQLDSLADLVGLGLAPLVLLFHHISSRGATAYWIIPLLILTACASAFRLARFNLLPPKKDNQKDSIGLSLIHTALTVTVAVLSDQSYPGFALPNWVYGGLLLVLSVSMVSILHFPPLPWFFSSRPRAIIIIVCFGACLLFIPPFTALLLFCFSHLLFSIGRALYLRFFVTYLPVSR